MKRNYRQWQRTGKQPLLDPDDMFIDADEEVKQKPAVESSDSEDDESDEKDESYNPD
jgi:hypothetical protein